MTNLDRNRLNINKAGNSDIKIFHLKTLKLNTFMNHLINIDNYELSNMSNLDRNIF